MRTYQQTFLVFVDGLYKAQNMSFLLERNLRKCTIVQWQRQVKNKKSDVVRSSLEMLLQLAVGIAVHQAVRSKQLITMLHGFGVSVDTTGS